VLLLAEGHGQVEGDGRLAHPALGREHGQDLGCADVALLREGLAHVRDAVHQVEARERHRKDAVDPGVRVDRDGVLGNGQDDDRHLEARLVDLLDELGALHPTLEERVDEHDIRSQLADLGEGLAAVADDVEKLDGRLAVQQPADVLRDLRHVLDDEEPGLIGTAGRT
jgi:hypothetical protein